MSAEAFFHEANMNLAGIDVTLRFRHEDALKYFCSFITGHTKGVTASVSEDEWKAWLQEGGTDNGYGEYTCSTGAVSDALLHHNRCIIHAVAFRFKDCAWLIAGPPGVGKTTQVRNLQEILPGEFPVICGDRPALKMTEEGVFVHPSPWNGKEGLKGAPGALLSGLIILERSDHNSFSAFSQTDAIFPLLSSLICTAGSEETVHELAKFADAFLRRVPVYKLTSFSVPESTELLYNELFAKRYME